jgi:hypothetical protein
MRSWTIFPLLALYGVVTAESWQDWKTTSAPCLDKTTVDRLTAGYTYLLEKPGGSEFNDTAESVLADDWYVASDSINNLSQRPVSLDWL